MRGLFLLLSLILICSAVRGRAETEAEAAVRRVITDAELLPSPENASALAAVMRRAEAGEAITIALIGGSITMGTVSVGTQDAAYPKRESYSAYFESWWRERFPQAKFTFVNAGIGGTDSYLGVHRIQKDVLKYDPDLILIEFSVNDDGRLPMTPVSYESLVRRALEAQSRPAVMLLFMAQTSGATAEPVHRRIGEKYRLPMVPLHTVFARLIQGDILPAKALSGDVVHPSALGHAVTGALLAKYLDLVQKTAPTGVQEMPLPQAQDKYQHPDLLSGKDGFAFDAGSFRAGSDNEFYRDGWTHLAGDAPFTAEIECRTLGILYLRTIDNLSGKCEVLVDGKAVATLDGDFPNGWGRAITAQEILADDTVKTRHVELRVQPGEKQQWILLGFLVSK